VNKKNFDKVILFVYVLLHEHMSKIHRKCGKVNTVHARTN